MKVQVGPVAVESRRSLGTTKQIGCLCGHQVGRGQPVVGQLYELLRERTTVSLYLKKRPTTRGKGNE